MKTYQTEQRKKLLEFLRSDPEHQFTIDIIAEHLSGEGMPGKSTVYRLMSKLVEEGCVRRFVSGNSRHFVYQIHEFEDCANHFHLKCIQCGKLVHLECKKGDELIAHIFKEHKFSVDSGKSVLYGICEDCADKQNEASDILK